MKKALFPVLVALLALLMAPAWSAALEKGELAPDFTLENLEGEKVSLSDYRGRIVLLKLATTWCPTCKQQTDEVSSLTDFIKENNIAVIEVFLQDSEAMIREDLKGKDPALPIVPLIDDGQARRAYSVYLIPRLLILDAEMKVRRDGNLITAFDLKRRLEKLIALSGGLDR